MKVKALAAELTRVIIKGDSTSNPREFDGLQNRITGGQLIEPARRRRRRALARRARRAIDAVPSADALIMSKAMRRLLTTAARNYQVGGFITYDKDAFGRRVTVYNDIPILVPYSDNGGTEPIAFDEAWARVRRRAPRSTRRARRRPGLRHPVRPDAGARSRRARDHAGQADARRVGRGALHRARPRGARLCGA
jgi:hypothetical protein